MYFSVLNCYLALSRTSAILKLLVISPPLFLQSTKISILRRFTECSIFGEGYKISTNQKRESTVFALLIG